MPTLCDSTRRCLPTDDNRRPPVRWRLTSDTFPVDSPPGVGLRVRLRDASRRSSPAIRPRRPPGPIPSAARKSTPANPPRSARSCWRISRPGAAPRRSPRRRPPGSPIPPRAWSSPASRPGCSAARSSRLLKAITAMKLAARGRARPWRAGRAGVLDRRRRSRLAGSERVYGARQRAGPAHGAAAPTCPAPAIAPDRPADPERRGHRRPRRNSTPRFPTPNSSADIIDGAARAPTRRAAAWPTAFGAWIGTRARTARPGRLRLVGSGGQAAGARRVRQGDRQPGETARTRRPRPATRSSRRAITRRRRSPTAPSRCST